MTDSYFKTPLTVEYLTLHSEETLVRALEIGNEEIHISGTTSVLAISLLLSQASSKKINDLPHLVVTSNSNEAAKFIHQLRAFDPQRRTFLLPHFDVSPYSGLYSKPQIYADRVKFFHAAQNASRRDIFVAPIGALLQKAIPASVLKSKSYVIRKNDSFPENIGEWLTDLGYTASPYVEDYGQFSVRGGIVDVYSPAHEYPVRIELFGDIVDSLRFFSPNDQKSLEEITTLELTPAREHLFNDNYIETLIDRFRKSLENREESTKLDKQELEEAIRSLSRSQIFPGIEFLLPYFYEKLDQPLDHFSTPLHTWFIDPIAISQRADQIFADLKKEFIKAENHLIRPLVEELLIPVDNLNYPKNTKRFSFFEIDIEDATARYTTKLQYKTFHTQDFSSLSSTHGQSLEFWLASAKQKIQSWKDEGNSIFVSYRNNHQKERLKIIFDKLHFEARFTEESDFQWQSWTFEQKQNPQIIHLIPHVFSESLKIQDEHLIFLKDEDFFGKKIKSKTSANYSSANSAEDFQKQARRLSFGDLKNGDLVVHILHGVGVFEGLKVMPVNGADSEFIQIAYKDKDKLYLPVYRVGQLQKYSGAQGSHSLDKLGGTSWEKTKTKVRSHLRDIASELLQLYAKRAELHRLPLKINETDYHEFEDSFPYDETDDQHLAINHIMKDFTGTKPMDRLVCGDVGFGKTEVAMRAAFIAVENKKQVAVLAPTTVLSFQHLETFKKRFSHWPIEIRALNRFVSSQDIKKTLEETKTGRVDILIGTHRVLSKDVSFADLGLMIIDEEQKFGVVHKEKIKKLKNSVDTLTLSATPIPRTLNMSLFGIRDLSLINTAPVDRLPTRTFISKFDGETIEKAIRSEVARGGQVYFIHNRVQSIYSVADELRQLMPDIRMRVGHGQMDEEELEKTMVAFFNHEIDVLICTTIVESGMDIPRANTMFIDNAHTLGLSQLYQLRGRVGRSKERAYCYLIVPNIKALDKDAQERLKVIQENTALGSGIKIAQYDLELRGSGNLLGEEQSGHVNAVGYELYTDLLNEAIHKARGEDYDNIEIDPEINLKIPAMIPDSYISDIRIRLSYYKALSEISSELDLEKIEEELKDQFGKIPDPTINLMGLMLIRSICKKLGVRDLAAGLKNISLIFTDKTPLKTEKVIKLAMKENKKYSLTPDSRLNIRMNNITWAAVVEELNFLISLI